MNKEELKELINMGESEKVEFKSGLSEWKKALETLSAFSWKKGGLVIFGVSPTGKVIGINIGKGTIEDLANKIKQNSDPKLYPSIKVCEIEEKKIIIVKIEKISDEPVLVFGRGYKRVGKSTHQTSREEYKKVILEKHEREFDSEVCENASLEDIDEKAVDWFRKRYREVKKKELGNDTDILKSLNCVKEVHGETKISNAGILLFGKNPQRFFPNSAIRMAIYPGRKVGVEHIDIKEFEGNLFELVDDAENYIRKFTYSPSTLKPGQIAREEVYEYGIFSLREIIVNAVVHRDYRIRGSKVLIKMFKDRVEFDSPGGFGGNVNESNILEEQFSRNPVIVKVFSKIKYIEEMGEGWNRIIDEIKNYPLKFEKKPEIKGNSRVVVSLFSPVLEADGGLGKTIEGLNEGQKKALRYVNEKNKITTKEYVIINPEIRERTARNDLNDLVRKGVFIKIGATASAYYQLSSAKFGKKRKRVIKMKNKKGLSKQVVLIVGLLVIVLIGIVIAQLSSLKYELAGLEKEKYYQIELEEIK